MTNEIMRKEVGEAIQAGEQALHSLRAAQNRLKSAGNWGLADIFGGGWITGMVKHSRINDAANYVEEAKRDLLVFEHELQDVKQVMNLNIEVGDFLTFADFFFDGVIADFMVQSKISDAKKQVADAIVHVEQMLTQLKNYY